MTLTGSDSLLRLSALAVSFVGWSAIVVTLRRALGAELSALHVYFVRFFIEGGLGRRRVTIGPTRFSTVVAFAISIMATLALWLNSAAWAFPPGAAAYLLALTWLLVAGGWVFVQNLELFLGATPARERS